MSVMTGKSHLQSNGSLVGPLSPIQADRNYRNIDFPGGDGQIVEIVNFRSFFFFVAPPT